LKKILRISRKIPRISGKILLNSRKIPRISGKIPLNSRKILRISGKILLNSGKILCLGKRDDVRGSKTSKKDSFALPLQQVHFLSGYGKLR
jgi:hypothetical protein